MNKDISLKDLSYIGNQVEIDLICQLTPETIRIILPSKKGVILNLYSFDDDDPINERSMFVSFFAKEKWEPVDHRGSRYSCYDCSTIDSINYRKNGSRILCEVCFT